MQLRARTIKALSLVVLVFASSLSTFHIISMYEKALSISEDGSTYLGMYVEVSNWLSENLGAGKIALVPMLSVFHVLNPELKNKSIDYQWLWKSAGITFQANTTIEEILRVRSRFVSLLKEDSQVKYVVRDYNDPYAVCLYNANTSDELMSLLSEVKVIPYQMGSGRSEHITIYENVASDA